MICGLPYANEKWPAGEYGVCRICGAQGKWGGVRVCPACWPTWEAWPKKQEDVRRLLGGENRDGTCPVCKTRLWARPVVIQRRCQCYAVKTIDDLCLMCGKCVAVQRREAWLYKARMAEGARIREWNKKMARLEKA